MYLSHIEFIARRRAELQINSPRRHITKAYISRHLRAYPSKNFARSGAFAPPLAAVA